MKRLPAHVLTKVQLVDERALGVRIPVSGLVPCPSCGAELAVEFVERDGLAVPWAVCTADCGCIFDATVPPPRWPA